MEEFAFSLALRNALLNLVFGNVVPTPVDPYWIGLSRAYPGAEGAGIDEPSGLGYARVEVANDVASWPSTTTGEKKNGVEIFFPTASGPWGLLTHFIIMDAETGGNYVASGALDPNVSIDTGDKPSFDVGNLVLRLK